MIADFGRFVWPDTEAVPGPHISARDDEPLVLFSDHYGPLRPASDRAWDPDKYHLARALGARHALALSPLLTALQTNRYLGSEWWRRAVTQTGRHSVIPTGRHSAMSGTGYLVLPSAAGLVYRGRRRAEVANEWRWPATVGAVAGAGLALVVLLVAASPVHRQGLAQPEVGGGMVAISNGQLVPVPACSLHPVQGDGLCVHKTGPAVSGRVYNLAAASRSFHSSRTALKSTGTPAPSQQAWSAVPSSPWYGSPWYGSPSYGSPSYGSSFGGTGRHARSDSYDESAEGTRTGGRHAADATGLSFWGSSGRHAASGGRHAYRSDGRHALDYGRR